MIPDMPFKKIPHIYKFTAKYVNYFNTETSQNFIIPCLDFLSN